MRLETLEADIVRRLRRGRLYRTQARIRADRIALASNAILAFCGGMCGLAVLIFAAAFVGLLPLS